MFQILLFNQIRKCLTNKLQRNLSRYLLKEKYDIVTNSIAYRFMSQKGTKTALNKNIPFSELINFRRSEAKRSVIVQVQSAYSSKELYAYCSQYGNVSQMLHYSCGVEPSHFILVEFTSEDEVESILKSSCFVDDTQVIPVQSPFLWFRVGNSKKEPSKKQTRINLNVENGTKIPLNESIQKNLNDANDISDQMQVLYNMTKLNDIGIRLRFLTARQVEIALTGLFPNAIAYPFGSSINGYGKLGCDLDLILKLDENIQKKPNGRLVYQSKAGMGNERTQSQRHMEAIGDILHLFLPGCSQVRRILQARVPILKYNQQYTDIECDLSMTNMTALHMSELLYFFGSIDERVRPLVFTVRKWATEIGLTNPSPGRWITNFSLTLLVLAFLQRIPNGPPILPSLNALMKLIDKQGSMKEINEDIPFLLNDITNFPTTEKNTDSLQTLLHKFFEYYANFDFATKAISLNEPVSILKPEHSPLYIVNPLERILNVSKNVSVEELERFRIEVRNANWILETQKKTEKHWGILALFESGKASRQVPAPQRYNRLMEVRKLFDDENIPSESHIEYKNEQIKNEVENIRRATREHIKEMSHNAKSKVKPKLPIVIRDR